MSPVWLSGLAALALVALAGLVAALSGGVGAACAVVAIGAIVVVGWHLLQLDRLLRWAAGPIDAQVPEGRGAWGTVFSLPFGTNLIMGSVPATDVAGYSQTPFGLASIGKSRGFVVFESQNLSYPIKKGGNHAARFSS